MPMCPLCDADVIEGADHCDSCGNSLTDSHLPAPATAVELALLTERVAQFQDRWPLVIRPSMQVREVLRLLVDNHIGCVVVVEHDQVVGIFTERDALMKIGSRIKELGDHPVREFMTTNVQSLPATAKIAFAVHRMSIGGYRHVPIVNKSNQPTGIFSVRDILEYLNTLVQKPL
ncbi:putative signal transduction protein with CBS domains [Pirellula staleyi DSM 6068]|uniref:Putative signal transduction protein with CBS domains n=1 Tax=Pirellula staleyi (strain ATCC 27377 / DSM 6068 / ICPB 4128) TaxID=530564 RepID=D2R6B5_PIRSD|nr:CBS domain-containing protein [Pirellula staleyi]ADB15493.1 putative signal transduction protein with CBS domains [Pirellula staleyi DSM 6068]